MGFIEDVIDFNVIALDITLKGKLMYEREKRGRFVGMLGGGLFLTRKEFVDVKVFNTESWKDAVNMTAEHIGIDKVVVIEL